MEYSDLWKVLNLVILPASTFICIISLIVFFVGKFFSKIAIKEFAPLLFSFAIVGGVVGIAVGACKTSAVGAVFPAIMTVFTLMLGYMFTNEGIKEYRIIIPCCLIALMGGVQNN